MANTLKDLAASLKLVGQDALSEALSELKAYIDAQDAAGGSDATAAIAAVDAKLNTLIGAQEGDVDTILNTFNEIKAFLADYDESDTLKSLIDAATAAAQTAAGTAETNAKGYADTKVGQEQTRATGAEGALSTRIGVLEDIDVMTASQAETIFDNIFYGDITLQTDPVSTGTVAGGGRFAKGTSITVVATPDAQSEYPKFDGWYENGTKVSSDASYTFTVNSTRTLVAKFVPDFNETAFIRNYPEIENYKFVVNAAGSIIAFESNSDLKAFSFSESTQLFSLNSIASFPGKKETYYNIVFDTQLASQNITIDGTSYTVTKSGNDYNISPQLNNYQG